MTVQNPRNTQPLYRAEHLVVRDVPGTGVGIVALRDFAPGERLFTVTGERTAHRSRYTFQVGWGQHVEPDAPGRYLNHSCAPNAGVRTRADGRPDIVAMAAIRAGQEITVDYAMFEEVVGPSGEGECLCGAHSCRGRIVGHQDTTADWRARFRIWTAAYLTEPALTAA